MKMYSWVVALLLALSLAFFGCGGGNGDDDDDDDDKDKDKEDDKVVNPIVDGASFLKISGRSESWHSIDIRAGKDAVAGTFTAGKSHTITVYGNAPKGTNQIQFANTDSPYGVHGTGEGAGWVTAGNDGSFKLEFLFTAALLSDTKQNIRIQLPVTAKSFTIYEIVINDGTSDIYKMSEDEEIQSVENGKSPFGANEAPTKWLKQAGSPVIQVIVPGEEAPPPVTCDYEDCDCEDCPGPSCNCGYEVSTDDAAKFAAAVALKGTGLLINEWNATNCRMRADTTTGIISRNDSNGTQSSLFSIDLSKLAAPLTITETNTIKIAVAILAEGQVKLTAKMPGTSTDLDPATYLDVTTTAETGYLEKTISIPAVRYKASGSFAAPSKLSFQDNGGGFWQMKIVSITVE